MLWILVSSKVANSAATLQGLQGCLGAGLGRCVTETHLVSRKKLCLGLTEELRIFLCRFRVQGPGWSYTVVLNREGEPYVGSCGITATQIWGSALHQFGTKPRVWEENEKLEA